MSGLDDWLPRYDHCERHERRAECSPEEALGAALAVPVETDAVVRALFRLRGADSREKSLEQFFAPPWATVLERTPTTWPAWRRRKGSRSSSISVPGLPTEARSSRRRHASRAADFAFAPTGWSCALSPG